MDSTRHLTEDTKGFIIAAGIRGIDNAVAVTIVVTFKDPLVANGRPIPIISINLSLLLEIEAARVATSIDIVGQVSQSVVFNNEGIAFCSSAILEKVTIVLPYTI